jgi:DNA adenine methylase
LKQKPLFQYFGGKTKLVEDIIVEVGKIKESGDYNTFLDVFGGAFNVGFSIPNEWGMKRIYNDLNSNLVCTMKVLQSDSLRDELIKQLSWAVNSREEFERCKTYLKSEHEANDLYTAYCVIYTSINSFGGLMKTFGVRVKPIETELIYTYTERLKKEWDFVRRKFVIEHLDFRELLDKYNSENIIAYFDPPYVVMGKGYENNFNNSDWEDLKTILENYKGAWIMNESGGDFEYLQPLFGKPYLVKEYNNSITANAKTTKRLEGYWSNKLGV